MRHTLQARRSLGQHFLHDDNIARKIAAAVAPAPGDLLLEIGPGEGALTRQLDGRGASLLLVEIDGRAVELLRVSFPAAEVLHGDVLGLDLAGLAASRGGRLRVAGNIPYNITTPILFHILDHRTAVLDATLMMQKEVAVRLAAPPGGKDYGILSVVLQLHADVRTLFDVSRNAFVPKPDVTSTVVRLAFLPATRYPVADERLTRAMVRAVFGQRRKTLRNSLRAFLERAGGPMPDTPLLGRRPEQLTIGEFADLGNLLHAGGSAAPPPSDR
jgi:16S rRNA (adenine1518-N6/adenine1519-N6)-dimethyltransferase